tara:strand:- start:1000 stop:1242 length:243 start_codon:yes stop_codon:yes gene_type:complete
MTGTIKFELCFDIDNDWQDADDTISHIKNIVKHEIEQLNMKGKFGDGVSFESIDEDYHDLTFKSEDDRRMDWLMATDPRV